MTEAMHALVVDDDPRIRTMLRRYLSGEGLRVSEAPDGTAMRAALDAGPVDVVLLDLGLPGEDGLSLARDVRRVSDVPIIILTGKGELIDRVVGLEAGADDYIVKPFELREVLARIRTVTRRARGAATPVTREPEAPPTGEVLEFDGWRLDLARRSLTRRDGGQVALTGGEFDLLCAFARHPNQVLGRDRLMDLVRGRDWAAYDRAIDTQVTRLRKKIESDPSQPNLIKTVRSAGYVFAARVTRL